MPDFARILEALARQAVDRRNCRPLARALRGQCGGAPRGGVESLARARSAYAASSNDARRPSPDAEALRAAIAVAGNDAPRLRMLRRLAARALHPDRGGDGAALAECNAMIDAALRTSRKRT